jgi:uncharacterized protein
MTQDMLTAVKAGDVARVRELLAADAGLANARSESGDSAILLAKYYGKQEVADILLAAGAELNIFEAAAVGDTGRIAALLAAAPDHVRAYAHDGWTPLHLAAFFGQREAAELLLDRGAETEARSRNAQNNTPLQAATAGNQAALADRQGCRCWGHL